MTSMHQQFQLAGVPLLLSNSENLTQAPLAFQAQGEISTSARGKNKEMHTRSQEEKGRSFEALIWLHTIFLDRFFHYSTVMFLPAPCTTRVWAINEIKRKKKLAKVPLNWQWERHLSLLTALKTFPSKGGNKHRGNIRGNWLLTI